MFTGIVESIGSASPHKYEYGILLTVTAVSKLEGTEDGKILTISGAEDILSDCHEGDSISVNGNAVQKPLRLR